MLDQHAQLESIVNLQFTTPPSQTQPTTIGSSTVLAHLSTTKVNVDPAGPSLPPKPLNPTTSFHLENSFNCRWNKSSIAIPLATDVEVDGHTWHTNTFNLKEELTPTLLILTPLKEETLDLANTLLPTLFAKFLDTLPSTERLDCTKLFPQLDLFLFALMLLPGLLTKVES